MMTRKLFPAILMLLLPSLPVHAAEILHRANLLATDVAVDEIDGEWRIDFPGADHDAAIGRVDLPARLLRVAIPGGESIVDCEWSTGPEISLGRHATWARIERVQGGPDIGTGMLSPTIADDEQVLTLLGYAADELSGREAVFLWRPLRLDDDELYLRETIELTLHCEADDDVMTRERNDRGAFAAGPFAPREFPSTDGSPVDAVIVTSTEMAAAYQVLADWHIKRGSRTIIRTMDWIEANYITGVDKQQSIRLFLQDAYRLWGLQTVILGGDTDQIPTRYVHARSQGAEYFEVPTDAYYACLEGDWNANGNSYWGEAGNPAGDDVNLVPQLAVGRMTTRSSAEAEALINKTIAYRENGESGYQNKMALMAEVLFPSNWSFGDYINRDGAEFVNSTVNNLLDPDIEYLAMLENDSDLLWTHLDPVALTRQAAYDTMNTGNYAFIDHCGHGYRYTMSVGDGSISPEHVQSLTNPVPFHISLMNCTSTAYDFDCLGENILRNPDHGAIAVFGTSRNSFPDWNWQFMSSYYTRIFQSDETRAGEAVKKMRTHWAPACMRDGFNRWTYFIITLLGDPLLDLWAGEARTFSVTAPAGVNIDDQVMTINVAEAGSPAAGAHVTAWKEDEVWATGQTDASGDCNLNVRALTPGDLTVTVWGANAFMQTLAIPVTVGEGACVHLSSFIIDDQTTYDPLNINDNVCAAGETVHLVLALANSGATAASNVEVRLHALSDSLILLDDRETFGYVPRNGSTEGAGELALSLAPGCEDGSLHQLLVEIIADSETRSDSLTLVVSASNPMLAEWTLSDPVEDGGNGDGVWDADEPLRAAPRWVNLGQSATGPLSASLVSTSPGLTIVESPVAMAAVDHLSSGIPEPGFLISLTDPAAAYEATLTLSDQRGRSWTRSVDFNAPQPPADLKSGASSEPDVAILTWTSSPTADLLGYNIYMKQAVMPEYVRRNLLPISGSVLEITGLEVNCLTDFYVTSVDSGGMESVPSDTLHTSTNPAQLPGFPLETLEACAATVAVGDVAGDNNLELISAGGNLHVWHHDGEEVHDGDNESQTFGVFTDVTSSITGSVTLLPLISNQYREIVVASSADNMIYAFDHEGAVLPGWPRQTSSWVWCNILGADLDGNGDLEVVVQDINGNIYAFNHDGTDYLPGSGGLFHASIGPWSLASPAAADFDGDGAEELVLTGTYEQLYVLTGDGGDYPGFPVPLDPEGGHYKVSRSPLIIADIDDAPDAGLEIILQSDIDSLYVFREDGSRFPGFPLYNRSLDTDMAPAPAPVDIDGDGDLELLLVDTIGGGASWINLVHHDGTSLPGWPIFIEFHSQTSPVVGDVDGDGELEFIIGSEQGLIYGLNMDGSMQPGFPIDVGGEVRGTPTLADLDRDGDVELIVTTWNRRVLVWDMQGVFGPDTCPWPTSSGNYYRNGLFGDWDDVPVFVNDVQLTAGTTGVSVVWSVNGEVDTWDLIRREQLASGQWGEAVTCVAGLMGVEGRQTYLDESVESGATYRYSTQGWYGGGLLVDMVLGEIETATPVWRDRFVGAWPNPFNPSTSIRFETAHSGPVRLAIYSVQGRHVRTLIDESLTAGPHEVTWDGRDSAGQSLASGVYLSRMSQPRGSATQRLVLLK
ncbi:MAG: T9SS type A sorting domain-containing protein [bacterium]|nr:T9SS type A sorting domain-containing protein [bacterium]